MFHPLRSLLLRRSPNLLLLPSSVRHASQLTYTEHGTPCEVLKLTHREPGTDSGVLVEMRLSPVNPADINTIQGKYPITPPLPAVGGGEGVGVVREVKGQGVKGLQVGDWVIPSGNMKGTWTTHMEGEEQDFIKIPSDVPLAFAATLRVNPCTAYRMLSDFEDLKPGDVVVQNGANSHCGQAVIQIAKKRGLVTVNVIRDREGVQDLKQDLMNLGADHVLTEEEMRKTQLFRNKVLPSAKLALNCVGGDSSTQLMKCLQHSGTHVTYGGMSMKPVTVATSGLIFKDLQIRGFWMSRWIEQPGRSEERAGMIQDLCQMARDGEIQAPHPHTIIPLDQFQNAFEPSLKGKAILDPRSSK